MAKYYFQTPTLASFKSYVKFSIIYGEISKYAGIIQ